MTPEAVLSPATTSAQAQWTQVTRAVMMARVVRTASSNNEVDGSTTQPRPEAHWPQLRTVILKRDSGHVRPAHIPIAIYTHTACIHSCNIFD
ncbi:unnamed protein product [Zymoseptoria tritici ST99CH_1A5]|uniref:Uncharacterized protein n=1 Tax=Zymoseptoria tritici ST99CH_1A5 TaxID=1276529 RepID=A0A1Y6LHG7_ZYMTR|nr:unnamed protein product [Zymoseptoria tritici ST99CH_1A5]